MDDGRALIRNEVLGLTSDFRIGLERLMSASADAAASAGLTSTSRSLTSITSRTGITALSRWSNTLDRMAALGGTLARSTAPEAGQVWEGLIDALGIFEQSLDACFEDVPAPRLERYGTALLRAIPEAWRGYADLDEHTFAQRLRMLLPSRAEVSEAIPPAAIDDADAAFQRELLDAFMTEVTECFERSEALLVRLEKQPNDRETLNALFREFHTLKGAAAAVELPAAAEQLHEGESLLQTLRDGELVVDSGALVDFLLRLSDSVRGLIDQACGRPASSAILTDVAAEIACLRQAPTASSPSPPPTPARGAVSTHVTAADDTTSSSTDPLSVLAELRKKVASGDIDPQLLQVFDALDQRARHFSQMAASLQQEVNSLRMVPLDTLLRRLQRPARDAARREGKGVEVELVGGELRIDRVIAERLSGPLMHLIRNAVAHGIEQPLVRAARGKPHVGCIRVSVEQTDGALSITIADDGGGLDFDGIRAKAAARGWIDPARPLPREELAKLIFRPGFSTCDDVTDLAGRGVGMDVVAREIETLRGHVGVDSHDGHGVTVRLTIPTATAAGRETPQ